MADITPKKIDPARPLKIRAVYAYDPSTLEYRGQEVARESPLEPDQFLYPLNTTQAAPPEPIPAGQAAVYSIGAQTWALVVDLRGTAIYSIATGVKSTLRALGDIPSGYTTAAPAAPGQKWNGSAWVGRATLADSWDAAAGKWVTNLDGLRKIKLAAALDNAGAAAAAVTSGYTDAEVSTWPQQLAEANLLISTGGIGNISTPLLTALAAARSMDIKVLAQAVIDKSTAYASKLAAVIAAQRSAEAAIANATTVDALNGL